MKKLFALLLALCMVLALCACGSTQSTDTAEDTAAEEPAEEAAAAEEPAEGAAMDPADLKVGMVCVGDENSGYDYAHISGLRAAAEALGIPEENLVFQYSIDESEAAYDACVNLAEAGCSIIFTDSYGHQSYALQAAQEYEDITFVSMTGDLAAASGLDNYKNAFCDTYQSRYVSGVVAGLKLKELVDNGELSDENYFDDGNIKIGYVGAFPYAEVISGYTSFFLGIRSVVENVEMNVSFTNSWGDPLAEASAADALLADGCVIIGQHVDNTAAPSEVQAAYESGSVCYSVGYNVSMLSVAPDAALTSAMNDWSVYYTYALSCILNGEDIDTDWAAGYNEAANYISDLGDSCAEGTAEYVADVEAKIADGSLQVFDCSTFTVDGETITTYPVTDFNGNELGEAIVDGAFQESVLRAAPYFDLQIDGINQLIEE